MDNAEVYRQIKAKFDEDTLPPRFIFAREPGSQAPYRFRRSVHPQPSDKRLMSGLRARGLKVWLWSPKLRVEPSKFEQSTLYSILCDIYNLFHLKPGDR